MNVYLELTNILFVCKKKKTLPFIYLILLLYIPCTCIKFYKSSTFRLKRKENGSLFEFQVVWSYLLKTFDNRNFVLQSPASRLKENEKKKWKRHWKTKNQIIEDIRISCFEKPISWTYNSRSSRQNSNPIFVIRLIVFCVNFYLLLK